MLLCLLACSDYELKPDGDVSGGEETGRPESEDEPAASPDLVVTPDAVTLETCTVGSASVMLENVGDADLELHGVSVHGSGWTAYDASLPEVIEPGNVVELDLSTTMGLADLVISSNDPDEPELTVPLLTVSDSTEPEVSIVWPSEGEVMDIDASVALEGLVLDEDPEATTATWTSDVDGTLGASSPGASGATYQDWALPRTGGDHLITLEATDACGNIGVAQVQVCQQAGYDADNLDISAWHFEGAANWDSTNDWLELTQATGNQVGTAFQTDTAVSAGSVEIEFRFYVSGGSGADGISLTALDVDRASSYTGGTGCGIGYGGSASCTAGPALPGWSLELDTYQNGDAGDPADDHLAFTFDGDVDAPQVVATLPEMEDGAWHTLLVQVSEPHLYVEVDGVTYIDQDVSGNFGFDAWVGFTAATGGLTNYHLIDALTVTEYVCDDGDTGA